MYGQTQGPDTACRRRGGAGERVVRRGRRGDFAAAAAPGGGLWAAAGHGPVRQRDGTGVCGERGAVHGQRGGGAFGGVALPAGGLFRRTAGRGHAETGEPGCAIELPDGRIVTGKTGKLLGASAAALLNALKVLADIDDEIDIISSSVIEPIQRLKVNHMGSTNPRLHTDEILIALSICAATDETAALALKQLPKLRGLELHSTVILADSDEHTLRKLGLTVTSEPIHESKKLYHK